MEAGVTELALRLHNLTITVPEALTYACQVTLFQLEPSAPAGWARTFMEVVAAGIDTDVSEQVCAEMAEPPMVAVVLAASWGMGKKAPPFSESCAVCDVELPRHSTSSPVAPPAHAPSVPLSMNAPVPVELNELAVTLPANELPEAANWANAFAPSPARVAALTLVSAEPLPVKLLAVIPPVKVLLAFS